MKLSDQVNELFAALSKFQAELDPVKKSAKGHGYNYAKLEHCIEAAKPVLAKHGLAVSQMLGMAADGKQTLITILTHSSGQYMSSEFVMVDAKLMGGAGNNPAQVLGSAITYQRRYAYAAIVGLAQEDDDGASVGGSQKQPNQQKAAQWFNEQDFEQEKLVMIEHVKNGGNTQEIISSIEGGRGLKISPKVKQQIMELSQC